MASLRERLSRSVPGLQVDAALRPLPRRLRDVRRQPRPLPDLPLRLAGRSLRASGLGAVARGALRCGGPLRRREHPRSRDDGGVSLRLLRALRESAPPAAPRPRRRCGALRRRHRGVGIAGRFRGTRRDLRDDVDAQPKESADGAPRGGRRPRAAPAGARRVLAGDAYDPRPGRRHPAGSPAVVARGARDVEGQPSPRRGSGQLRVARRPLRILRLGDRGLARGPSRPLRLHHVGLGARRGRPRPARVDLRPGGPGRPQRAATRRHSRGVAPRALRVGRGVLGNRISHGRPLPLRPRLPAPLLSAGHDLRARSHPRASDARDGRERRVRPRR